MTFRENGVMDMANMLDTVLNRQCLSGPGAGPTGAMAPTLFFGPGPTGAMAPTFFSGPGPTGAMAPTYI